jgi:hypothetical protein
MENAMKPFVSLLVVAMLSILPGTASAERRSDYFCRGMAGMSIYLGQVRDKGIPFIDTTLKLQIYLDEHPDFPATAEEKEYALHIVEVVYKFPDFRGDVLADFVYRQCTANIKV